MEKLPKIPKLPKLPGSPPEIKEEDLPWEVNGLKKGNVDIDEKLPKLPMFKNPFKKEIKEEDLPWEVNGLKKGNKDNDVTKIVDQIMNVDSGMTRNDYAPW